MPGPFLSSRSHHLADRDSLQEVFEASLDPPTPEGLPDAEERDRQIKASVINLLFLGELSKIQLLPPKLLFACMETLLAKVKAGLQSKNAAGVTSCHCYCTSSFDPLLA